MTLYMTMKVRKDDAKAVREFIRERRASEQEARKTKSMGGKYVEFWNSHLDYINGRIKKGDKPFHWTQLVRQELEMWALLGDKVDKSEFSGMCKRRGFNTAQKRFLSEGLKHLGLKDW